MSEADQPTIPGIDIRIGNNDSDCCFTPIEIIEGAERCLGHISTDPCWHPRSNVRDYDTRYDGGGRGCGLSLPWFGHLWLNPPYSDPLPWARRYATHAMEGHRCLALVKLDCSTGWWRQMTVPAWGRLAVGLVRERVRFEGAHAMGKPAPFASALIARNVDSEKLTRNLPMADWWVRR